MKQSYAVAVSMLMVVAAHAAQGKHIAKAVLQNRAGATVAAAPADPNGTVRFTNVPPGEYQLVLTNADGRSVTLADLDGDGHSDLVIEAKATGSGMGTGKVSMQDMSVTRSSATAATPGASPSSGAGAGKVSMQDFHVMKTAPGGQAVVAPRDAASGLPTGRRMHKPMVCLVDWDLAKGKGGFTSERVAQAEGQALPDNVGGRCVVKVVVEAQPGTIEVQSWSWGMSQPGKTHAKTGHVTLMK